MEALVETLVISVYISFETQHGFLKWKMHVVDAFLTK